MHFGQKVQSGAVSFTVHHTRKHEISFCPKVDDAGFDHLDKVILASLSNVKLLCLPL